MVVDWLWPTSYALTAKDLYTKFDFRKLKQNLKEFPEPICTNPIWFLSKIFRYFFYLVIVDIIENKAVFKFPKTSRAYIEMLPVSGERFVKARQHGAFQDVDFLTSNFTGYQLGLRYNTRYGRWIKALHVTEKYKDRITELTNQGHGW